MTYDVLAHAKRIHDGIPLDIECPDGKKGKVYYRPTSSNPAFHAKREEIELGLRTQELMQIRKALAGGEAPRAEQTSSPADKMGELVAVAAEKVVFDAAAKGMRTTSQRELTKPAYAGTVLVGWDEDFWKAPCSTPDGEFHHENALAMLMVPFIYDQLHTAAWAADPVVADAKAGLDAVKDPSTGGSSGAEPPETCSSASKGSTSSTKGKSSSPKKGR